MTLRVALDIGGVMSKYPDTMRAFAKALLAGDGEVHVVTDMHDHEDVLQQLEVNGFDFIPAANVHCADYKTHGEGCKAELLEKLGIHLILDDFIGYVAVPGGAVRCLVMPDASQPYWHPTWNAGKAEGSDFGRRVYRRPALPPVIPSAEEQRTALGEEQSYPAPAEPMGAGPASDFLRRVAMGGSIVSSSTLTPTEIAIASAAGRMLVTADGLGFVYVPA